MTRGQSETIGFVLVFALIVTSTGIVYVAGFQTLGDARTTEELRNMERAFDVLDDSISDVARRGAPSRSTEVSLGNGDLAFGDTARINVTTNVSAQSVEISPRPIVYRLDGTEIVYVSDAVIRTDRGSSVMRSDPAVVANGRRVVLPLIDVDAAGDRVGVGGDTTALIRTQSKSPPNTLSVDPDTGRVTVTVTVESPRTEAWRRTFQRHGFTCGPAGTTVSCSTDTDELHVVWTTTSVDFLR
ncbi:DUF7289 family protein [Haloplanus salilacus]|uniref:DUF7289 family protein n=1 Tax=Haloplanus salilacus TaxID=2949994 RepID=UPI0030CE6FC9